MNVFNIVIFLRPEMGKCSVSKSQFRQKVDTEHFCAVNHGCN